MEAGAGSLHYPLGELERRLLRLSMRIMFRPVFGWRDSAAADLLPFEVRGLDGSRLSAAWRETDPLSARGVVLLCHPFIKYGMRYFFRNGYPEWLGAAGYHVVAFDFKGFGASTLGGVSFADDVASMVRWARAQYPALPLHLFGVSFGGYHAVHAVAARTDLAASISSMLLDSVPASIGSFFHQGMVGAAMRWLSTSRWAAITGTRSIVDSLSAMPPVPRLFLHGERDPYISADEIARIAAACGSGSIELYPLCGHMELRKTHLDRYKAHAIGFFHRHGRLHGTAR